MVLLSAWFLFQIIILMYVLFLNQLTLMFITKHSLLNLELNNAVIPFYCERLTSWSRKCILFGAVMFCTCRWHFPSVFDPVRVQTCIFLMSILIFGTDDLKKFSVVPLMKRQNVCAVSNKIKMLWCLHIKQHIKLVINVFFLIKLFFQRTYVFAFLLCSRLFILPSDLLSMISKVMCKHFCSRRVYTCTKGDMMWECDLRTSMQNISFLSRILTLFWSLPLPIRVQWYTQQLTIK